MGLEAFSLWLQEAAAVQEDVLMTGNPNADNEMASKDEPKNSTFSIFADDSADKKNGHDCPKKDGKHPLWKCEKFLKMTSSAIRETLLLLFDCEACGERLHIKACGGCNKRHHQLLHREASVRPKDS